MGATSEEILVPRVQDGVGAGVAGSSLPVPAKEVADNSMGDTTGHTGTQVIYGILSKGGRFHWMHSGGLQGAANDVYQPSDPLRALPRAGHSSDYGGREPPPPPLTNM